ncbi:MAG: Ni/Fe hydrogenase subunit alpha [Thermoplasmata archaeon]|jgi:sulfhydrogenase subunit alpha|nr:Ni/Fe hydrogenase subunit alpha [Thermoplasmata archaeon]
MKELNVEALARVEGDGGITVTLDGKKVKSVTLDVHEGPRLIEQLVKGMKPEDDLTVVPRICAICTLSHRYAALRGLEKALGITPPEKAQLTRELMMLGENVESNSLHTFLLALPDFLGYPSAIAMLNDYADDVKRALRLKKFGNHVMTVTSGRIVHGENPIIGGFGKYPSKKALEEIKLKSHELVPDAVRDVELFASLEYPTYPEAETLFMSVNAPKNQYGYYGDSILISNGKEVSAEDYKKLTSERVVSHSFAKRSLYQDKPFTVGANARLINMGKRLDGQAKDLLKEHYSERWLKNPLFNNLAQAIEMLWSLEHMPDMCDMIAGMDDPPIEQPTRTTGSGTGAVEAPRGTLYHHYELKNGLIEVADIITPTAQNLDDIEKHMKLTAERMLADGKKDDEVRLGLEMVARAYDPCISCATHLVTLKRI